MMYVGGSLSVLSMYLFYRLVPHQLLEKWLLNSQPSKTVQLSVGLMLGVSLDFIAILRFVLYGWIISYRFACAKQSTIHALRPQHTKTVLPISILPQLIRGHSWRHWVIYLTILWDILLYSSMICSRHWMVWYWSERRKVRLHVD